MAQDIQEIVDRIRSKDYSVQNDAQRAGGAAVPLLAGLLADPDEEIRQLAVYCLSATGERAVAAILAGTALFDDDPQVTMAAAQGLHAVATQVDVPRLLQAYDRSAEPLVKREIALVLGRVASPADVPEMKQRWMREAELGIRQGMTAALARLGDDDARNAFTSALRGSAGQERLRHLELAEYIAQSWLLRPLGEMLHDMSDVLRVAVDAQPDLVQALRACDIALVLIARIGGARYSFPVTRAQNYTTTQLHEVQLWVKANAP